MNKIRIKGWRGGNINIERLKWVISTYNLGDPLWHRAALAILDGKNVDDLVDKSAAPNYKAWLQSRGRWVIKRALKHEPEIHGFVKINPDEVDADMSTAELLAFCGGRGKKKLSQLIAGAPENGLSKPSMKLGRTLKGRGYVFPVEIAREYVKRLIA